MSLTDTQELELRDAITSLEEAFDELEDRIERSGVLAPIDGAPRAEEAPR